MRKRLLIIIGIVCLIGTTLATLSAVQHIRLTREGFENQSYCAVSSKINCDIVNGSSYSEVFGVPVAWWGMIYYTLLAMMSFFAAFSTKERRSTVSIAWFMALAGVPYCLYLAHAAYFIIGAVCLECVGMYVVNIFAAIALFFALKIPVTSAPKYIIDYARTTFGKTNRIGFAHQAWSHILVIAITFGIGWIAIKNIQAAGNNKQVLTVDEQIRAHYIESVYPIEPDPSWPVWGNPNANVKIVEFSEFQCPFCRIASFSVKPFLQEFRKDIAYYFANFPLDASCNSALEQSVHQSSCYLAKAALCAQEKGGFWEYHDILFRNQSKLSAEFALATAEKDFGWPRSEFQQCIDSPEIAEKLASQIVLGQKINLQGTPSIFLNGRKIANWRDKQFLQSIVREEIKRSKAKN